MEKETNTDELASLRETQQSILATLMELDRQVQSLRETQQNTLKAFAEMEEEFQVLLMRQRTQKETGSRLEERIDRLEQAPDNTLRHIRMVGFIACFILVVNLANMLITIFSK